MKLYLYFDVSAYKILNFKELRILINIIWLIINLNINILTKYMKMIVLY